MREKREKKKKREKSGKDRLGRSGSRSGALSVLLLLLEVRREGVDSPEEVSGGQKKGEKKRNKNTKKKKNNPKSSSPRVFNGLAGVLHLVDASIRTVGRRTQVILQREVRHKPIKKKEERKQENNALLRFRLHSYSVVYTKTTALLL
jgi:hypothetical protein